MSKQTSTGRNGLSTTAFDEMYRRIQKATGTKTQTELADILDIRQSSISDAKRRQSIPPDWVLKLLENNSINPNWIKYGTKPMLLQDDVIVPIKSKKELKNTGLESLFKELIIKIAPKELKSDIQRTFCLKYFHLNPSDTISDVLNRILPGNIAARVCANIQHLFLSEDVKEVTADDENDSVTQ